MGIQIGAAAGLRTHWLGKGEHVEHGVERIPEGSRCRMARLVVGVTEHLRGRMRA
jgi:hypothetical protein